MATKVKTAAPIPAFRPFNASEKKELKVLNKAMQTITQYSGRDIMARELRDEQRAFVKDEKNVKELESARKLLLKHGFTKPIIEATMKTFASNYRYIEGIEMKLSGKGALPPSLDRNVHKLTRLVADACGIRRDVMASTDPAMGEERKIETRNATMTLRRMLPPVKAPVEKPDEAASNFGARLATMKGYEKFNPSSINDPAFKKICEWILGGIHDKRVEEMEKKELEDAKAAVDNAKNPKAKAAAIAHLAELREERKAKREAAAKA